MTGAIPLIVIGAILVWIIIREPKQRPKSSGPPPPEHFNCRCISPRILPLEQQIYGNMPTEGKGILHMNVDCYNALRSEHCGYLGGNDVWCGRFRISLLEIPEGPVSWRFDVLKETD